MKKALLPLMVFLSGWLALSAGAQAPLSGQLAGAGACAECHASAYRAWQTSAHASANKRLPAQSRADARCVRCHGTATAESGGVQCESCHGPGLVYAKRHVMKDRELARLVGLSETGLSDCARCHTATAPNLRKFVPEQAWLLVRHGRDEKKSEPPATP